MSEEKSSQTWLTNTFTNVTPFSKYLAMILFIAMPFIGGWIGYIYAPVKIVEIEKVNYQRNSNDDLAPSFETKDWGLCKTMEPVTQIDKTGEDDKHTELGFEKIDEEWNRLFVPLYNYSVKGYCIKYPSTWKVGLYGAEHLGAGFNRDNNSTTTPELYLVTVESNLPLESLDKEVYSFEDSSSPLVGSNEVVVSRHIEQIGDNKTIVLVTKDGDTGYIRIFVKNDTTLYMLERPFPSYEYDTSSYNEFLKTAYEMISSIRPLGG